MHDTLLVGSSFLASAVEMVEAMTIILAVGVTRGWKAAFAGIVAASLALAVIVGVLGASLIDLVPLDVLQVMVGILLLVFGMQWMRKAIQRAAGLRAKHNEDAIFAEEVSELRGEPPEEILGFDWKGFVVSFKGVFLEGLEVAFIVVSFGANSGRVDLAAAGAVAAFLAISGVGLVVHRPLTRVPENAIKYVVAIMLMSFGTFWGGEGVGIEWTLKEPTILIIAAAYWASATLAVGLLKQRAPSPALLQASEA
jgi:uncharacterized membrane protein